MDKYQRPVYSLDDLGNRTDYPTLLSVVDGGYSPISVEQCLRGYGSNRHRGLRWAYKPAPRGSTIYSMDVQGNRKDYPSVKAVVSDGHDVSGVYGCLNGTIPYYHNLHWAYTAGDRAVRQVTRKKITLIATGPKGDTYFASLADARRAGHYGVPMNPFTGNHPNITTWPGGTPRKRR